MHRTPRAIAAAALLMGCANATNLLDPASPRFTGAYALMARDTTTTGPLRLVTFNIKLARRVDRAIAVAQPGAVVSPPPKGTVWGRIAFAIAVCPDVPACARALDAAQAALEVEVKQT